METVRLINWCIQRNNEGLSEKWLVRLENGGAYREIICEVHRFLLNNCSSIDEAINTVSQSHKRPIPYHPIDIEISGKDGHIVAFTPKKNDWEDLADIPALVNIAREIKLITLIVTEQEQPSGELLNKARCAVINNPLFCSSGSSKNSHNVAEMLTFLTGVKPIRLKVQEQHGGTSDTRMVSAKEALGFLKAHASQSHKEKATLTVYRLHMNKRFAQAALCVISAEILTQEQQTMSEPWWSDDGYVFIPNSFFRFVFFTDPQQIETCPLERMFLEQYFTLPCDGGAYNATCSKKVMHIFSRMVPPTSTDNETTVDERGLEISALIQNLIVKREDGYTSQTIHGQDKIAVFDYKMFYPYVLCESSMSLAYQRRVAHMAAVRVLVPRLKSVYTKELGMLCLVRAPLYNNMRALAATILYTLVKACTELGLQVLLTQIDSVTVRVSSTVMQANGGSLESLGSVLQETVRLQHPTLKSQLKLERQGTDLLIYGANKHVLYDGENVIHRTGFNAKTFCPAMYRTIQDATASRSLASQLLCTSDQNTDLLGFVSKKMKYYAQEKWDLVCESYGLTLPILLDVLHVQPGNDAMFSTKPILYLATPHYLSDNEQTRPTLRSFTNYLNAGTSTPLKKKHLDPETAKCAVEKVFSEKMGLVIRWSVVMDELIEHFITKSRSFLRGGRLV